MSNSKLFDTAVVGAGGLVGEKFLEVLERRNFPVGELTLYSTMRSAGQQRIFRGEVYTIVELSDKSIKKFNLVLFSAGAAAAKLWAGKFAETRAVVVDNSSAFRQEEAIPLVVPEINGELLYNYRGIIANPNCSTIGMVAALFPLHKLFRLKSVIVTSYQSVSGAGRRALEEYRSQIRNDAAAVEVFTRRIGGNVIPQIGDFLASGESVEEGKFRDESRKIMGIPDLEVVPTAVRVPVEMGHSLALHAEFYNKPDLPAAREALSHCPGLVFKAKPEDFPTPREIAGSDEVFAGRLRQTEGFPYSLDLWVCSDNLLKGAALNAVQIAEKALLSDER